MLTLLCPVLAVIVLAQCANHLPVAGEVVDDTGQAARRCRGRLLCRSCRLGQRRPGRSPDPNRCGGPVPHEDPAHRRTEY